MASFETHPKHNSNPHTMVSHAWWRHKMLLLFDQKVYGQIDTINVLYHGIIIRIILLIFRIQWGTNIRDSEKLLFFNHKYPRSLRVWLLIFLYIMRHWRKVRLKHNPSQRWPLSWQRLHEQGTGGGGSIIMLKRRYELKYSTPETFCWKKLRASSADSRPLDTL